MGDRGINHSPYHNRLQETQTMAIEIDTQVLVEEARKAQELAHAPYSDFHVGAALLCEDGAIYTAGNIEAKPSTSTLHAEVRAMSKAVEDGKSEFLAMAIVTPSKDVLPPCGTCRNFLATFQEDLHIICGHETGNHQWNLKELLPEAYTGRNHD